MLASSAETSRGRNFESGPHTQGDTAVAAGERRQPALAGATVIAYNLDCPAEQRQAFRSQRSGGLDNGLELTIVRAVNKDRSERPPSVRQTEFLEDGTLVIAEYNPRGQVVRKSYYCSADAELLERILARTFEAPDAA